MNNPLTLIFLGLSGCGKGTQAELLKKHLEKRDGKKSVLYITTGKEIRHFCKKESFTSILTKETTSQGKLLPNFMAIWAWSHKLVNKITKNSHVIFDGSPRSIQEAMIMDDICHFYHRETMIPLFIEISEGEAKKRMKARGRSDDTDEAIEKRLDFFKQQVQPTLQHYQNKIIRIDGEQSIPKIFQDILGKLGFEK